MSDAQMKWQLRMDMETGARIRMKDECLREIAKIASEHGWELDGLCTTLPDFFRSLIQRLSAKPEPVAIDESALSDLKRKHRLDMEVILSSVEALSANGPHRDSVLALTHHLRDTYIKAPEEMAALQHHLKALGSIYETKDTKND